MVFFYSATPLSGVWDLPCNSADHFRYPAPNSYWTELLREPLSLFTEVAWLGGLLQILNLSEVKCY